MMGVHVRHLGQLTSHLDLAEVTRLGTPVVDTHGTSPTNWAQFTRAPVLRGPSQTWEVWENRGCIHLSAGRWDVHIVFMLTP